MVVFLKPNTFRLCAQSLYDRAERLDLRSAAVNEQFNTSDETGVIRSQKQRRLWNFVGLAHPSHRNGGNNPRKHLWRLPIQQWRIDRTGTNHV